MKKWMMMSFCTVLASQNLQADVVGGFMPLNATWDMHLGVLVDKTTDTVHIQLSGPANRWFAVGFNNSNMSGTYTIVAEATGANNIVERKMVGNGNPGSVITSGLAVQSDTVTNNVRTVYLTRPRIGATAGHYTFADTADTIPIIYARGTGTTFSNHTGSNRDGSKSLTKETPAAPKLAVQSHGLSGIDLQLTNLVFGVKNHLEVTDNLQSNTWSTAEVIELAPPSTGPIGWLFSSNVTSTVTNDTRFFRISQ